MHDQDDGALVLTQDETTVVAGGRRETFLRRARLPLLLFLAGLVGFALPAWDRILEPSPHFHFVDLAHSFLQGRLDTDTPRRRRGATARPDDPPGLQAAVDRHLMDGGRPTGFNDWASYRILTLTGGEEVRGVFPWKDERGSRANHFRTLGGDEMVIDLNVDLARVCEESPRRSCDRTRYFVSFPPFPAVVMLPLVMIWNYHLNDVLLTVVLAALNLTLMFLLLETLRARGWSARSRRDNVLLALLFAFGTVHYFSAVRGEVWFTALILGVTLHTGYVWAALDTRRPLVAGALLAAAMATRTPLAFGAVFFGLQLCFPGGSFKNSSLSHKLKQGTLFALPLVAVGVALMLYNQARFESPFEFGHRYLLEGTRASIRDHGLFSWHFLNQNLSAAITNMPRLSNVPPFFQITRHGLGIFVVTPFFLYLLWPERTGWDRTARFRHLVLWISVACVAVPALLYQNTGWEQFGYRFSLDWTPYMMVLLAMGRRKLTRGALVVLALSVAINLFGAITFTRFPALYY